MWKVSTVSFWSVDIKSHAIISCRDGAIIINCSCVQSCFIEGTKKEKEKRDFPLAPNFLIGWCALTVHSFKVLYTHVSWIESSYDWRSTVGLTQPAKDNLALLSRRRQTQNNVQSLFFNRVWHRCATGTWENLFARILFAELIDYFNVMVVCE